MKTESRNLFIAVALSIVVIFATNLLMPKKTKVPLAPKPEVVAVTENKPLETAPAKEIMSYEEAVNVSERIDITTPALHGSIRLKGARFDDLFLSKYKQTQDKDSLNVNLLEPSKTATPYYAEFGWTSTDSSINLPNGNTNWHTVKDKLTPETPLILEWNNGQGLKFVRKISVDENYMFTIEDSVDNASGKDISIYPYGFISRVKPEGSYSTSVVHEGMFGVFNSTLKEEKYKNIIDEKKVELETTGGWAGFSDRYWFSAMIFDASQKNKVTFQYPSKDTFQTDYLGSETKVEAGIITTHKIRFYAGAKEVKLIDKYKKDLNIDKFDLSIDFGWYYFLTKPFFYILDFLYHVIGNMGWAILLFAALLRLVMFPIAGKSFESMSKMKKIQPKVKELQEKYKEDKIRLQQETMALYRKEKINPAAGCLPVLIQIPVFFSLYKVLNIAIEIRHAPFIGWIKDLSAPDPLTLSVITHLPIPSLINIGVWPILMGVTMWVQQKLNPAPVNKDQARMFAMMPIIFTFMMGHFASGLVIYWTLSNILSIIQQKTIMRKYGVK